MIARHAHEQMEMHEVLQARWCGPAGKGTLFLISSRMFRDPFVSCFSVPGCLFDVLLMDLIIARGAYTLAFFVILLFPV